MNRECVSENFSNEFASDKETGSKTRRKELSNLPIY